MRSRHALPPEQAARYVPPTPETLLKDDETFNAFMLGAGKGGVDVVPATKANTARSSAIYMIVLGLAAFALPWIVFYVAMWIVRGFQAHSG